MKKNYYSLFAAATMLMAATSCSQVEDFEQSSNEMTTFKVQLESGAQSRAYGEGALVDKLYYEVYYGDECIIDAAQEFEAGTSEISVTLPLVKGKQYDVIFWAQKKESSIYNADNLKEITASYDNAFSNQEAYDAFFGALDDYTAGNAAQTVELYRPFAQLNIATTNADLTEANKTATDLSYSEVTVKNIANKFNALTGVAEGDVEANFGAAEWDETETKVINGNTYTILAMNYLLVPGQDTEEGKAKATVEVSAAFKDGENAIATIDVPNVPIQRNYRTNIYGNIFTGQNVFNVEIKPGFDDEEYEKWYDIVKVAQEGGTITLTEDVTMPSPLVFTKDAQINLNGFTFKGGIEDSPEATGTDIAAITIVDGANLVITGGNGGKIEGTEYGIYVKDGSVTIKDGIYKAGTSAVQVFNGTANIEGGNFSCTSTDKRYVINCIDDNYDNGTAIVSITGGTFEQFDPSNCEAEGAGTNFVADGYSSAANGDYYVVGVNATTDQEFVSALNNENVSVINSTSDIDCVNNQINLNNRGELVINMEGNQLIANGYAGMILNDSQITLNEANLVSGGFQVAYEGAELTFNSGSVNMANITSTSQRHCFYAAAGGVITINGGTFTLEAYKQRSYACAVNGGIIYIKGGDFGVAPNHQRWTHPIYTENGGQVIITGGTFGFDPSTWVAEGYVATETNGTWTVAAE